MEQESKRFMASWFFFAAVLAAAGIALCFLLDPFQIYRPSPIKPGLFIANERYQNAGIVNQKWVREGCCDTIIIGTSHSQNFLPSHVAKTLGTKGVLHLAMSGSLPLEQKVMFDRVLREEGVKIVLWEAHTVYADEKIHPINDPDYLKKSPNKFFPLYLYDSNRFNDLSYLASVDTIIYFLRRLDEGKPYETLKSWYAENVSSFGKGERLLKENPKLIRKEALPELPLSAFPNLEKIMLPAIDANPDISFLLFVPPYSRLYLATLPQEEYARYMAMRIALARALKSRTNAKLYVFDDIFESVEDLDDYKDVSHYSEDTSKRIIETIAKGEGELKEDRIQRYVEDITARVNRYIDRVKASQ